MKQMEALERLSDSDRRAPGNQEKSLAKTRVREALWWAVAGSLKG